MSTPADRPLGVLIHTRYSTDEQSQSSLDGQINVCQRFLTANIPRECRPEQVNVEIFERTANDEPPWAVADWLTSIRFPKAKNSQKPE